MSATLPLRTISPMFASIGDHIPGAGWAYEPKYDGIRVIAVVSKRSKAQTTVQLITRNQKDKAFQFPEIVDALRLMGDRLETPFILDGEIVALQNGTPSRFQYLQGRIHIRGAEEIAESRRHTPTAFIAFDLLTLGTERLVDQPWVVRRDQLERLFRHRWSTQVRTNVWLGEAVQDYGAPNDNHWNKSDGAGETLLAHARTSGWEGIIAKQLDAPYAPGARTLWWQKLKVEFRQEFVVGGYTEPRRTRPYFGALLLGYYENGHFVYAGHVGSGFDRSTLKSLYNQLHALEQLRSPFQKVPRPNERPHWVHPKLVVEIKFTQWTNDGRLRHPIFVGVRDDLLPQAVGREARSVQYQSKTPASSRVHPMASSPPKKLHVSSTRTKTSGRSARAVTRTTSIKKSRGIPGTRTLSSIIRQIDQAEAAGEGILAVHRGEALAITNVDKVLFPESGYTKGDLMRYYTSIAPVILPTIKDRPLVLKRFPDGIDHDGFYQHRATNVPPGVRTDTVSIGDAKREQIVGGDLFTLLYTLQLGSISVDPWHARVPDTAYADYAILDLDPGKRASFATVVAVARYVKEALDEFGLHGALKTSGATGLHIYLPLPRHTTNESAQLVAELVATHVATLHPTEATVERVVRRRKATTVYVDHMQNILGKTIAGPYSVRARPNAPVSAPLAWEELDDTLDPSNFTIITMLDRLADIGDIWAEQMRRPNKIDALGYVGSGR